MEQSRRDRLQQRDVAMKKLGPEFRDACDAHFQFMPARYFLSYEPEEIAEHLNLFQLFFERRDADESLALAPAFRWIPKPEKGYTEVWVCGWDRPRLLERIAGAFLSVKLNILSADIYTRTDSLALDIFRVASTNLQPVSSPRDMQAVESRLAESLGVEEYDFTPLISKDTRLLTYRLSQEFDLPTRITIDIDSHPAYTLVDIQTPDRLGLLYDLLRAMGEADACIEISRITTEMDVAMDSFYIYNKEGGKFSSPQAVKRLQNLLHKAAAKLPE